MQRNLSTKTILPLIVGFFLERPHNLLLNWDISEYIQSKAPANTHAKK